MNERIRKQLVMVLRTGGASAAAMSVVFLARIENVAVLILLSSLAGTLGNLAFWGLGTLLVRLEKRLGRARPGGPVYALAKLPPEEAAAAGGKGRALARLYQAGFPVPDGCVLLPCAFRGDELTPAAWSQLQQQLTRLRGGKSIPFAVRSSALSEDSAQASFAGEFESVLDVSSDAEIRAAVGRVLQSRRDPRVAAYRRAQGLDGAEEGIAVIVQKLVRPDYAGVLFTANPLSGDLAQMSGNFVSGLGDKLVAGQVSASEFSFARPEGTYTGPAELQPAAKSLHRSAHEVEAELGGPQDIEWAVVGRRVFILQARPITTLNAYNPDTADWNDSLKGNFLWSATNLTEAYPQVLTPFTASLRPYLDARGGPALTVKGYPLNGVIAGRFYANLSVQISAFVRFFKGDARRTYRELAGWWGEIPEQMDIPLLPLTGQEWSQSVLPELWRTNAKLGRYRKQAAQFAAQAPQRCAQLLAAVRQERDPARLANLWDETIFPLYRDSIYSIISASSDGQVRLEQELGKLVGTEDANALLSNLGGADGRLESLGPLAGLEQVRRGTLSRAAYLEAYGHRGANECECAWPRPLEDPAWLDRQLADTAGTPFDIETRLARQRGAYQAAWERFCRRYPAKAGAMRRRLEQTAQAAQRREMVRSASTRLLQVVRAFALRAGEIFATGEDVFFLTIDEVLAGLRGGRLPLERLPQRRELHERYRALPPYPAIICGRFDPFAWAADPDRRSDLYDARAGASQPAPGAAGQITGAAGALGTVEGRVRRLDRLEDGGQLQAGEVLVTTLTNIGWTPLFPRAAAIVTDLGAPLSHAAIVARELGIPAVVGCGNATMRLKTGDRVRVDGGRGVVEIVG